ncbi:hypothetical protein ECC02_012963 [Trypanosoma cruzi]|uniref:Uncharacterized protein n=1 Tax=Trypanosoma cruzi TaxID=5693 RepID=A0A7J6XJS2_TRYCR|nr:hypothetical protein ECC02_012963 [Trypanosoma cruzi]
MQRERADNMRRGQQAQPHTSHTTRRHPRKEGTQRQQPPTMQEENTSTTISPQLISTAPGKWPKPRGHHTTHTEQAPTTPATRSSGPSSIHDAATKFPAIPPSVGHGAQLNAATRGASHPQERRLGLRAPSSSLLLMATEEDNSRHTQLPACTAKGALKSTAMCILCVWLCVPAETQSEEVEKRKQSVWRDAQKCTAETHGGNNKKKTAQTHDCTAFQAVAIHTRFIQNKKKRTVPFVLYKPHHTK